MNTSNAISSKVITFESKLEGSVFSALPFFLKQNINRKNENQSKLSLPLSPITKEQEEKNRIEF
jgi:hypothetical protein